MANPAMQKKVVVVGNGMVGQRFVELLADRDPDRHGGSSSSARSPGRPTTGSHLSSATSTGKTADDLDARRAPGFYDEHGIELHLGDRGRRHRPRGARRSPPAPARRDRLRRAGPGHRLVPVRAAGARQRPARLLRLPHDRRPRRRSRRVRRRTRAAGRRGRRRRPARARGGERAAAAGLSTARRRVRAAADAACRSTRAAARCCAGTIEALGVTVHTGRRRRARSAATATARARAWPVATARRSTSTSWSSPPASGRATSSPATAGLDGRRARRHRRRRRAAHHRPRASSRSASARCSDGRIYGLVAPGYEMAEVVADRLLAAATPTFTGADLSTKLKLLGVDVASFGDALGRHRGRARGRRRRPGRRHLHRSSCSTTRRAPCSAASSSATPARYGDRCGRMVGRCRCPSDPVAAASPPAGTAPALDRAATTRRSAPATTSPRARSAARSREHELHRRRRGQGVHQGRHRLRLLRAAAQDRSSTPSWRPASRSSTALCEHFALSRGAAVRRRAGAPGSAAFTELVAAPRHRRAAARSASRPSPRSSPALGNGHILDGEQAALQDTNDHFLANLQKQRHVLGGAAHPRRRDHARQADRHRRGRPRLRPLHQDHRRPAHRPVRRPGRAAARRSGSGWSTPASSPATRTASRCAR